MATTADRCTWSEDCDGNWSTECGEMCVLTDGSPSENSFCFCPFCGHTVTEEPYADPDTEEE